MNIRHSLNAFFRRGYAFIHWPRNVPAIQEISYGDEYADKRFLVIRRYASSYAGLLSFFMSNLSWIRYAKDHGMTPVVDMQTALNQCLEISEVGKKNAWEFYFEQPCGFSLKDIACAKNVFIANADLAPCAASMAQMLSSPALRDEMRALTHEYIRVKADALSEYDNPELETALSDVKTKVIGIRARGTDYCAVQPHGHPIQPTADDFIQKIANFPSSYPIYLVSEDQTIITPLQQKFGSRLILSKQETPEYHGGWMPDCRTKHMSRRQEGAGYLKAIYDLSRCPILLAGNNNGTAAAYLLAKGFEHFHMFTLGAYA